MIKAKALSAKQLAVIEDLFVGELQEQAILENHNISRKLYDKWLTDEGFNEHLDRRMVWEYRRCEFMLAHYARVAASNLVRLTDCKTEEAARKSCLDIITMRTNRLAGTPAVPVDNPMPTSESLNLSPETTGKLLAVLAEEKTA